MTQRRNVLALAALGTVIAGAGQAQPTQSVELTTASSLQDLLKLTPRGVASLAMVAGYHVPGDGGGGLFVWQATAVDKPDGGLVFGRGPGNQPGRWRRVIEGSIDVRMFGAKGDGKTDDTVAIQAAIDAAAGAEVRIPAGTWRITRTLQFRAPSGKHSPGLKLIGEGAMSTVIDCRNLSGPAINIEQAKGYDFGMSGILRDFELSGIRAQPGENQHGIVMSGAWLYRLDRVTIIGFRGHGLLIPFVNDRGVRYSDVDVVAGSDIVRRTAGHFRDSLNFGEVVIGDGIAPETFVDALIDDNTVRLSKPALRDVRSTLNIYGKNTDGQQTILTALECRFISNKGWGIYNDAALGLISTLRDCQIGNNEGGGIRTGGWFDMQGGTCTSNGTDDGKGCGILLESRGKGVVDHARLEAIEIDANREVNLWLRQVRFARVTRCRFNAAEIEKAGRQFPESAIRLGDRDGSGAHTVEFSQNMIRAGGVHLWPHVGFDIPDGAGVENIVARDTVFWGGWSDAHHAKYRIGKPANPAALLRFEEDGRPAAGLAVPAPFVAKVETAVGSATLLAGASSILQFTSVRTTLPKPVTAWPMVRIAELATTSGSSEAAVDQSSQSRLAIGMPLLMLGDSSAPLDRRATRLPRLASVGTLGTLGLDQPQSEGLKGPAIAGGVSCPYEGYFAVDVVADVRGIDKEQAVSLTLLVDGKSWRKETTLVHGLVVDETLRLSAIERWAVGTVLHASIGNISGGAISLTRASLTLRLLA